LLSWAILAIVDVWLDRWGITFIFGGVTCLFGAVILTAGTAPSVPEQKESRGIGLLLLILGTLLALMEAYDRFVVLHR
jgi:hypothetical protein